MNLTDMFVEPDLVKVYIDKVKWVASADLHYKKNHCSTHVAQAHVVYKSSNMYNMEL